MNGGEQSTRLCFSSGITLSSDAARSRSFRSLLLNSVIRCPSSRHGFTRHQSCPPTTGRWNKARVERQAQAQLGACLPPIKPDLRSSRIRLSCSLSAASRPSFCLRRKRVDDMASVVRSGMFVHSIGTPGLSRSAATARPLCSTGFTPLPRFSSFHTPHVSCFPLRHRRSAAARATQSATYRADLVEERLATHELGGTCRVVPRVLRSAGRARYDHRNAARRSTEPLRTS